MERALASKRTERSEGMASPVPKLGPPPPASSEQVSRSMKGNRPSDTQPELLLRSALRLAGWPGYRLGWRGVPGRPDIAFPGRKLAIFVHGCYWHRCPHCSLPLPRTNTSFWKTKFERNVERDNRKRKNLEELGWKVVELWECQIRASPTNAAATVSAWLSCIAHPKDAPDDARINTGAS